MQMLQDQMRAELQRRAKVLPNELEHWNHIAAANTDGMGIHRSQMAAVRLLFDELDARQKRLLEACVQTTTPADFAVARMDLEQELSATHGLLAIFRYILNQRADPLYCGVLDLADLIAAECYKVCIEQARDWDALQDHELRVPPLTYLNSMFSPAAYTRRHTFGAFKLPLDGYLELKLPISVLSLPFHHAPTLWTFCSLYHEVGHLLDQDLNLRDALRPFLAQSVAGAHEREVALWEQWLREMIADCFGVLLGGVAFARALATLLMLPAEDATTLDPLDRHPTPYVRIFLLGALLRESKAPDAEPVATQLEQTWRASYGEPAHLAQLTARCKVVGSVLLQSPLTTMQGHHLSEFGARLSEDHELIKGLAEFLRINFNRPNPKNPLFPYRLIPAAAQLAVQQVTKEHPAAQQGIQDRALRFAADITRPQFLGPLAQFEEGQQFSPEHENYLRGLAQKLDFSLRPPLPLDFPL